MLLAMGFRVRYRGWDNVEEGRHAHAVRGKAAAADSSSHTMPT